MTTIIADTLDAYARTQETTFVHDRSTTVGASEVGQCMRKVFWIKQELRENGASEIPVRDPEYTETWGARLRGSMFEQHFWLPAMRARFGERLLYAGDDQRTLVSGYLSATPDGLLVKLTRQERMLAETRAACVVTECKTLDPRASNSDAKPVHVFQTHVQVGLFRELTTHQPERAVISYTDTSFWSETKEFVVRFDPNIYDIAKTRADRIMRATKGSDLPPEGWISGGDECRYCPFTRACGIERRRLPYAEAPIDDPQFVAEMTDRAIEYKQATAERDRFDSRARELQDTIKNRLREKGVKRIPGLMTWSAVKGRVGYDIPAMIADLSKRGVSTDQYQTIGEASDRLSITVDQNNSGR